MTALEKVGQETLIRAPRSLMAANLRLMQFVHNNITHILVIAPSVSFKSFKSYEEINK